MAGESNNTASEVEPQQQKYVTPASGMANLEITVHPALTVTLELRHHTLWRRPKLRQRLVFRRNRIRCIRSCCCLHRLQCSNNRN
ncbi:hypothetical protein DAPPUDRAFT_267081 [Daphnia pulex]|uniref:Uncharacterized protein n=1 Tax=Daphnia pulex TaxID=6669 RepID=E9HVY5_DAPPU|nr:hypothetical protein DAPPUDRAFT_267081 [Daphnia pulex]|eukprot:EFX64096.1 hypothetical protein DAPPUDRAFT_267081 [Daphnia pulex]